MNLRRPGPGGKNKVPEPTGEFSAGRVVILSTHIAADIENSCRDLAILDKGRIRYRGSVSGLLERAAARFGWSK